MSIETKARKLLQFAQIDGDEYGAYCWHLAEFWLNHEEMITQEGGFRKAVEKEIESNVKYYEANFELKEYSREKTETWVELEPKE